MKKLVAMIMIFAVCIMCFGGCEKKTDSVDTISTDQDLSLNKELHLTVWTTQGTDYVQPTLPDECWTENWRFDKTKVKVDNVYGNGGGQWEAMFTRLVAGDNFPELVHCGAGQGPTHFAKFAEVNKVWELTPELLEKYAPDIWKKVPKTMWERIKINGKIYGIPYNFPVSKDIDPTIPDNMASYSSSVATTVKGSNSALYIRDDILKRLIPDAKDYNELEKIMIETNKPIGDELVLPIKSTEEFVDFMYKIKDLNLTENGRPVYAMGFSGGDCWIPLTQLGGDMMGYKSRNYACTWNTKTEKIEIPLIEPIIKETAKIEHQMILDGVIEPESLVHTPAQYKEKILNGQYAIAVVAVAGHPPVINEQIAASGKTYKYIPFITQVPAKEGYETITQPTLWNSSVCITKAVSAEDVPQVLNWMNSFFTDESEEISVWGTKEANLYEELEDGTRRYKDENFQKYYVEGDSEALPANKRYLNSGLFLMKFLSESRYRPMFYNNTVTYSWATNGAKMRYDSKYRDGVIVAPPCNASSPEYANIESVQQYWSSRSQWEDPFKLAFAAKNTEEFEKKWDQAISRFNEIVNVKDMTEQMTAQAKKYIEQYLK